MSRPSMRCILKTFLQSLSILLIAVCPFALGQAEPIEILSMNGPVGFAPQVNETTDDQPIQIFGSNPTRQTTLQDMLADELARQRFEEGPAPGIIPAPLDNNAPSRAPDSILGQNGQWGPRGLANQNHIPAERVPALSGPSLFEQGTSIQPALPQADLSQNETPLGENEYPTVVPQLPPGAAGPALSPSAPVPPTPQSARPFYPGYVPYGELGLEFDRGGPLPRIRAGYPNWEAEYQRRLMELQRDLIELRRLQDHLRSGYFHPGMRPPSFAPPHYCPRAGIWN